MKSKWIWKNETNINDYAHFFKTININEDISNSTIKITAHNHFKLYVNKQLVSGYVVPAPSVANKEKLYLKYNLKDYLIKGNNLIEVVVLYLGDYGQNYKKAEPGLWLELKLNNNIVLVSDKTWKVLKDTNYTLNMPFQQSRKITPIEKFDNNIKLNYNEFNYSIYSKMNDLNPLINKQKINEGHLYETIEPKLIKYDKDISVFDVGKIISGFVGFSLKGFKDLNITIRYSENLDENNFVGHNVANEITSNYKDIYIMSGNKLENHQFDFTYKAFRYFQIEGYNKRIKPNEVRAMFAGTKITIIKENKPITNDWRVDKIYEMFVQTQKNNTLGLLTDCPHREQAQYLGDSDIQLESVETNVLEAKELMDKVLTDFMNEQFEDGRFPYVAPTNFIDPFNIIIPEYDLYYSSIMLRRYKLDKDINVVKKYIDTLMKSINYTLTLKDSLGLLRKTNDWHISDWPYPTVNHNGTHLTVYNLLALKALENTAYFLKELNYDKYLKYQIEASALKKSIRKHLIVDGLLIDSLPNKNYHQGVNALGILTNVFLENEKEKVVDFIISKGFNSSVILGRSTLRVLQQENRLDLVYKYLFEYEKGWMPMIKKGNLTFFEGYDDIESHSHAWQGFPIRIIQDALNDKK